MYPLTKNLYVYGEGCCGNYHFIDNLMNQLSVKYAENYTKIITINCAEGASLDNDLKALYDEILYKLQNEMIIETTVFSKSVEDFFLKLHDILIKKYDSVYIIFDSFEKLNHIPLSNLCVLANLSQYINLMHCKTNLITIFVSNVCPNKMFGDYTNLEVSFSVNKF